MVGNIRIIIPYFGHLPCWMQLFLDCCGRNELISFLIFTDDFSIQEMRISSNVRICCCSFGSIQERFKERLTEDLYLEHPYKLCDYRPAYGWVFQDYLKDFSYWGYCDIDLIFGDIMSFLKRIDYNRYDRLFSFGHLTIYRNTPKINNLFREKNTQGFSFPFVCKTTYPCHFDEIGMNDICTKAQIKWFKDGFHLQVDLWQYHLRNKFWKRKYEIITYEDGKIYSYGKNEDELISKSEHIYFHFQARSNMPVLFDMSKVQTKYYFSQDGFKLFFPDRLSFYMETDGKEDTLEERIEYVRFFKQKVRKGQMDKFWREIKYNRLRSFYYICKRIKMIVDLRKRGIA